MESCCQYRRKLVVGLVKVLGEEECGVPDSELADLLMFDVSSPGGKQVLSFLYCPWCGARRTGNAETRITEPPRRVQTLTPVTKCEIITCPGLAFPGITMCLGHARERHGDLIPDSVLVHCGDCGVTVAKPMPAPDCLGICTACHRKRFDAGDIL